MDGPTWEIVKDLLLAGVLGGFIGLERQYTADLQEEHPSGMAGLRTFSIIGLLGAATALLAELQGAAILATGLAGITLLIGAWYAQSVLGGHDPGVTTEVVAILTFCLGAIVQLGFFAPAAAGTAAAVLLLRSKRAVHAFSESLTERDVWAALQIIAITALVLPLVPDRAYDPWGVLNPYHIWIMVVLVAGIGFVGYVSRRLFGDRAGFGLAGLLGGLASSTAVTLNLSKRSADEPRVSLPCALGIVAACTILVIRVAVEVAAVHAALLRTLAWPLVAMFVVGLGGAGFLYWRSPRVATDRPRGVLREPPEDGEREEDGTAPDEDVPEGPGADENLKNPVDLTSAIVFGLLYGAIGLAAQGAQYFASDAGIYVISIASGLTDVDAITLNLAHMSAPVAGTAEEAGRQIAHGTAVRGIVLAAISNSLVKGGLALSIGARLLGWSVLAVLTLSSVAGGLVAFLIT